MGMKFCFFPQLESEKAVLSESLTKADKRFHLAEKRLERLTQQLSDAQSTVQELEQVRDQTVALGHELAEAKGQVSLRDAKIKELELVSEEEREGSRGEGVCADGWLKRCWLSHPSPASKPLVQPLSESSSCLQ